MSFILDALKKSEAERQRARTPGVADIPDAPPPSRTPRWLWLVAGLLTVNLAVLAALLLRPGAEAGPAVITERLPVPDTKPAPAFSELVAEAKQSRRAVATQEPSEPATAETAAEPRAEPAAAPAPARAATPPRRQPVDFGTLPTFDELRARGELSLPDLHLDLHVYAERPADRFVVVNLGRYREGAALSEGPIVRQIEPAGVVLEHQGKTFFLPRL